MTTDKQIIDPPDWLEPLYRVIGLPPESPAQEVFEKSDDLATSLAPITRRLWKLILVLEGMAVLLPLFCCHLSGLMPFGYNSFLHDFFIELLRSHMTIKRVLLQDFATRRKLDRFKQSVQQPRVGVSPIPISPSKRDFVLLSAGVPPFHYHNRIQRPSQEEQGLAIYLDVSGSVNAHLPEIIGVLEKLKSDLTTIFLFSKKVIEVPWKA